MLKVESFAPSLMSLHLDLDETLLSNILAKLLDCYVCFFISLQTAKLLFLPHPQSLLLNGKGALCLKKLIHDSFQLYLRKFGFHCSNFERKQVSNSAS